MKLPGVLLVLVYYTNANPLIGLVDPSCFVVSGECPNENVTFWLYSNSTRDKPILLDPLDLNPGDFQPPRPLKILVHGYTGNRDFAPNSFIRPVLLDHEDVYVISIDYGPLVRDPCYIQAVQNLPLVSQCLAQLINNLVDRGLVQNDLIHIIGFSLGGQVAGQTANYLKRKLKRITGLDPAKPLFVLGNSSRILDPGDADFVDVIHTDTLERGILHSMGHVDFYPNFGVVQPGCLKENPNDPGSCNHERAPRFYAESINSTRGFWGHQCVSWSDYIFGLCPKQAPKALMGYHVEENVKGGLYFLKTGSESPFALGQGENLDNNNLKLNTKRNNFNYDYELQLEEVFQVLNLKSEKNLYTRFKKLEKHLADEKEKINLRRN